MNCEVKSKNGLRNFLAVRSLSIFLLGIIISFCLVSARSSLTVCAEAYSGEYEPDIEVIQEFVRTNYGVEDFVLNQYVYSVGYGGGSDGSYLWVTDGAFYVQDSETTSGGNDVYCDSVSYAIFYFPNTNSCSNYAGSQAANTRLFGGSLTLVSNLTIYHVDGSVFFRPAPVLQKVTLMMTPGKVLGQILGLLPLLIPCLAGLVAFSKGWQFLSNLLRKA